MPVRVTWIPTPHFLGGRFRRWRDLVSFFAARHLALGLITVGLDFCRYRYLGSPCYQADTVSTGRGWTARGEGWGNFLVLNNFPKLVFDEEENLRSLSRYFLHTSFFVVSSTCLSFHRCHCRHSSLQSLPLCGIYPPHISRLSLFSAK